MENVKYWMDYYIDEVTTYDEIKAYFDFEEGLKEGIETWNTYCENGNEVTSLEEEEVVREVALGFFNQTNFISTSIVQAMIAQSF